MTPFSHTDALTLANTGGIHAETPRLSVPVCPSHLQSVVILNNKQVAQSFSPFKRQGDKQRMTIISVPSYNLVGKMDSPPILYMNNRVIRPPVLPSSFPFHLSH